MDSPHDKIRSDLTALWAAVTALRTCETRKAKGEFLIDTFKKHPQLVGYFRACYGPGQSVVKWHATLPQMPAELFTLANLMLLRDLQCGVDVPLLNKVFTFLEPQPPPLPYTLTAKDILPSPPEVDTGCPITIELHNTPPGFEAISGVIYHTNQPVANVAFRRGVGMAGAMRWFKEAGIRVIQK